MSFGSRLSAYLKKRGITVTELAQMTGINRNTLYSIIRRDTLKVDPGILQKIAEALGVSLMELSGLSDTFADRLCTLQALKSCDNKFLADELEVDEEIIDRMRNGDYSPNLEEIDALAAALDCSREDLIGGEGSQADREDEEMWQLREEMRRTPELRTLFDAARNAKSEDLRRAISIIEALKKESEHV